jgi:hypothetical protein
MHATESEWKDFLAWLAHAVQPSPTRRTRIGIQGEPSLQAGLF